MKFLAEIDYNECCYWYKLQTAIVYHLQVMDLQIRLKCKEKEEMATLENCGLETRGNIFMMFLEKNTLVQGLW